MSLPFMQPYMGLGNSLQTAQGGAGGGPSVGGWVELARTTLGSAGDTLAVSSFANKRYYMVLYNSGVSTELTEYLTFGSGGSADTGSNYSNRISDGGGADSTFTSRANMVAAAKSGATRPEFGVSYISNLASKEKLMIHHAVNEHTIGAGTAPARNEVAGKWANTSNALDTISWGNFGSGDFPIGAEMVVLGWDPEDTHTSNFWEELASVNASGSSTNLSSGTITAKKYLWIQCYSEGTGGDIITTFNNDTGSNYTRRYSIDGGADGSDVNQTAIDNMHNAGLPNDDAFSNWFIINNSANEKLIMGHSVQNGSAGAGTAPPRLEFAGKWTNTASQITEIDFDSSSGNFGSNSIIKVWGSD